jgi:RHS repeat-associated protein
LAAIAGVVMGRGYGRPRTLTTPEGYSTTTDYDLFDRVTKVTYPDGSYDSYTYDRLDLSTVRDRLGRVSRFYYNARRELVGTRDPLGRTVQQIWGPDGSLDRLLEGKQQGTSWEYDVQGRVTREVRADSSGTTYTYEPIGGRLKTVTDPEEQVKTYTYFLDDALASVAYSNANIVTPSVSYSYDAIYARVSTMVDGLGTTTYAYHPVGADGAGQVSSVDGPRANDTLTYTYDELGRVTNRTLNTSGVGWVYDALGRVTSETNPLGAFAYTYDGVTARPATTTYPNGQTTTYSYYGNTGDRRLQTLHHKLSGGATLSKFDYTYDRVGNILSWQQQVDTAAPTQWTYTYDLADQLASAFKKTTDPTPTLLARFQYSYDQAANRTSEQIGDSLSGVTVNALNRLVSQQPSGQLHVSGSLSEPGTVTVNGQGAVVDASNGFAARVPVQSAANALTVVATDSSGNSRTQIYDVDSTGATKSFSYDANGNMTSDGSRTFEWDAENRLVAVIIGTHRSEFTYDGQSRRVRIVEKDSGVTIRDASMFWTNRELIEERLTTGEINRFLPDGEQRNGTAHYRTKDLLGNIREVTSSTGSVVERNDYDPYGRIVGVGTASSRFGLTGHDFHQPSGLYLTLHRAYDPELARWLSEDPTRFSDGLNLYNYVRNQPTTMWDPFGLAQAPPGPPPIPLPPGRNGEPNRWVPGSGSPDRPVRWKPEFPVDNPKGSQPNASWDPKNDHWDRHDGRGNTDRFDRTGKPVDHWNRPLDKTTNPRGDRPNSPGPGGTRPMDPIPPVPDIPTSWPGPFPLIVNPCLYMPWLAACNPARSCKT